MRLRIGASGAERLCALGAIMRVCAAPQLHSLDSSMSDKPQYWYAPKRYGWGLGRA